MRSLVFAIILITGILSSCGTLGGFETVKLSAGRSTVKRAIDSLYSSFPQYKIPDKWKKYDSWGKRGYTFLDGTIFYFATNPEEMYYVTFVGDSVEQTYSSDIAVRAISKGSDKWILENEVNNSEKERIENRFKFEIVSKLEKLYADKP